jgi:serine protease Do
MRKLGWLLALSACAGAAQAQYARRTAIVEAVNKTRDGIITLKVSRDDGAGGRRELVGTAVLVDERGYAVTNYHVVRDAVRVAAALADKTSLEAAVYATSPRHDLAILRLPVKGKVKALPLGCASDLMVGETVIAVGNPFGYANTVSTGIVSALGREVPMGAAWLKGLIQHSASINPGNSGGPLLNVNGELIGINVALREGAQNISFAINAETVKEVLAQQLSARKMANVDHGLKCSEAVTAEAGERQRVVVEAVAAADTGLRKGDVLLKLGGLAPRNRFDVERALWGCKAGDKVPAVVLRDGQPTELAITLAGAETARR